MQGAADKGLKQPNGQDNRVNTVSNKIILCTIMVLYL
jgi:hypothetical protein